MLVFSDGFVWWCFVDVVYVVVVLFFGVVGVGCCGGRRLIDWCVSGLGVCSCRLSLLYYYMCLLWCVVLLGWCWLGLDWWFFCY